MGVKSIHFITLTNTEAKVENLDGYDVYVTEKVFTFHPTGEHVIVHTALTSTGGLAVQYADSFIKEYKTVQQSSHGVRNIPILELQDATEVTVTLKTGTPPVPDRFGRPVTAIAVFTILDD